MNHPVVAFLSTLRPPAPAPLVFVDNRTALPIGHTFECDGVRYQITSWQYRTRIGYKIAVMAVTRKRNESDMFETPPQIPVAKKL